MAFVVGFGYGRRPEHEGLRIQISPSRYKGLQNIYIREMQLNDEDKCDT